MWAQYNQVVGGPVKLCAPVGTQDAATRIDPANAAGTTAPDPAGNVPLLETETLRLMCVGKWNCGCDQARPHLWWQEESAEKGRLPGRWSRCCHSKARFPSPQTVSQFRSLPGFTRPGRSLGDLPPQAWVTSSTTPWGTADWKDRMSIDRWHPISKPCIHESLIGSMPGVYFAQAGTAALAIGNSSTLPRGHSAGLGEAMRQDPATATRRSPGTLRAWATAQRGATPYRSFCLDTYGWGPFIAYAMAVSNAGQVGMKPGRGSRLGCGGGTVGRHRLGSRPCKMVQR